MFKAHPGACSSLNPRMGLVLGKYFYKMLTALLLWGKRSDNTSRNLVPVFYSVGAQ